MKRFFISLFVWVLPFFALGQENAFQNGDFLTGIDGWSNTGNTTLTHTSQGAQTSGAAAFHVVQTNGNYANAQLVSPRIDIPPALRGNMFYLLYFGKSKEGSLQYRARVELRDTEGRPFEQRSDNARVSPSYEKHGMPVYVAEDIASIRLYLQCGIQAGTFYFDDFVLVTSVTPVSEISLFDEWKSKRFHRPENIDLKPLATGQADVTLTVNVEQKHAPVMATQFGVNSNCRSGNDLLDRVDLYTGMGSFRYPAGSGSNQYFWDCDIPDAFQIPVNTLCGTAPQFLSPENYVTFKKNARGEGTVVVNYFYARYGVTPEGTREARVLQAAEYAAGLVRYLNIERAADIKYWEIGNECYGPWETGYDVHGSIVTGKEYGEDFVVFAQKMKAVDPGIQIGAVLSHNRFEWNNQVLREVGNAADFLIVHHYFTIDDFGSAQLAIQDIKNDMQEIQAAVQHFTEHEAGHFPVAFTEFNIQGDQATTITNGLFVADVLATMVESRFSMTNIWVNEWKIDGNHSKGLLAKEDPDQPDFSPRPTYTPYYFYDKYFGDQMVEVTRSGSGPVKAFASTFAHGETGIVLINYGADPLHVSLQFAGAGFSGDSVFWHTVHADNKNAGNKKFFINGQSGPSAGGGPEDFDAVPAFASPYDPGGILVLPKLSATYLVITTDTPTSTHDTGYGGEKIYPNPTPGSLILEMNGNISQPVQVFDVSGRNLNETVGFHAATEGTLILDLSMLLSGLYLVQTPNTVHKVLKH